MAKTYTQKVSERKGLSRKPISEVYVVKEIQNSGNHKCEWVKEERQTHDDMTTYVCKHKRCGRGLMLTKDDDIKNYSE